jgi:transposase
MRKTTRKKPTLYAAIDLHSNNSYLAVLDDEDRSVFERRLRNRLDEILAALEPFRKQIHAVAVESTFNWYWLVDGLIDHGYEVRLVNTSAVRQYEGHKHTNDRHDARWLAHLMRLGILPVGYIMPRETRAIRDLLRKRLSLVQQRTGNILSAINLKQRNEGVRLTGNDLRSLTVDSVNLNDADPFREMAMHTTLEVILALDAQIDKLEKTILATLRPNEQFQRLKTIWGVGPILSMTILLETGPMGRFPTPGDYASYCRCVKADRLSNGKSKGSGNTKCGNSYLAWAWIEAATAAIRHYPQAKRFYDRKASASNTIVARKALAHKLARAAWHMITRGESFEPTRVFC